MKSVVGRSELKGKVTIARRYPISTATCAARARSDRPGRPVADLTRPGSIRLVGVTEVAMFPADPVHATDARMTARRPLMVLALVSALTGCVGQVPSGPLVEYCPGQPPATRQATCEASYVLVAKDADNPPAPPGEHRLRKGDRAGFVLSPTAR